MCTCVYVCVYIYIFKVIQSEKGLLESTDEINLSSQRQNLWLVLQKPRHITVWSQQLFKQTVSNVLVENLI